VNASSSNPAAPPAALVGARRQRRAATLVTAAPSGAAAQAARRTDVPAYQFPAFGTSAEPWCALVPDGACAAVTRGAWLPLPADCTAAVLGLKAYVRTFMDNALHAALTLDIAQLPQLPASLLAHDGAARVFTSSAESKASLSVLGRWADAQLARRSLQRSDERSAHVPQQDGELSPYQQKVAQAVRSAAAEAIRALLVAAPADAAAGRPRSRDDESSAVGPKVPPPPLAYAPFVGLLPPPLLRDTIDKLIPRILEMGLAAAQQKLKGNAATAFIHEGHAFRPYFVWACSTYAARTRPATS